MRRWTTAPFAIMRLDFYDYPEPIEMFVEMRLAGIPSRIGVIFNVLTPSCSASGKWAGTRQNLCMDDGFMDCPWRERGQWLGDARVEALVAAYAFGDTALARKALLQYPQSQEESGWFRGVFPSDPPFDAILPTFCMIWPVALWDYFLSDRRPYAARSGLAQSVSGWSRRITTAYG